MPRSAKKVVKAHPETVFQSNLGEAFKVMGQTPSRLSPPSRNLEPRSNVQTASSSKLGVGTSVVYKQMGKAETEFLAVIVDM